MRRVMIVGHPGSGKTTVGQAMSARLGLPLFHADRLIWLSPGQHRSEADLHQAFREIMDLDGYVLEGGHRQTYQRRFADCDTLVWLDLGLPLCLWRVWRRARVDRKLRSVGSDTSGRVPGDPLILKMLRKAHFWDKELSALAESAPPAVRIFRLRSPAQVRQFISDLGGEAV